MSVVVGVAAAAVSLVALSGQGADPVAPPAGSALHCLRALTPLAAGAVPQSASFAPAACSNGAVPPAFSYNRESGYVRLSRALAEDEIVPVYPQFGADMVRPGQTLRVVIGSGAVRVEREVEALQAARPGQRLFVRASDGQVFSVRYGGGS